MKKKGLTRRDFLKLAGATSAGFALSACGIKATELPSQTPIQSSTQAITPIPHTSTPLPTQAITPIPHTSTPLPTINPTPTAEVNVIDIPQTKTAVDQFVNAMNAAGIKETADQALSGMAIKEITGKDGKKYEVATVHLNPDPTKTGEAMEGDYPLMIKGEGREWEVLVGKKAAEVAGLDFFGCLIEARQDGALYPQVDQITGSQFSAGTVVFSWKDRHPSPDKVDDGWPDWQISRAKDVGISKFRLHALVMGEQLLPPYANFNREQLINEMEAIIESQMNHFIEYGVKEFVVVNESFYPGSGRNDSFQNIIGDDYVEIAFKKALSIAQSKGSDIKLMYNDTHNQKSNNPQTAHTKEVVQKLLKIDGMSYRLIVGMQMHLTASEGTDSADISKTMEEYGIPVEVTELSIDMTGVTDKVKQAQIWEQTIKALLEIGECKSITVWGLGDKFSWEFLSGKPSSASTLYYDNMDPKLSLFALEKAMIESVK